MSPGARQPGRARVREPAVAGYFYPGEAGALRGLLAELLAGAAPAAPAPKALVAPHAGYVYSGRTAAAAYACIAGTAAGIRRVLLLGPSHRVPFRGLALSEAEAFATPLGSVPVDAEAVAALQRLPQVGVLEAAHSAEHSLEVHLPFLQSLLGEFKLVPLVVGDAPPAAVAEVIEALWGGPETAIVVSSDLSHYLDYESAVRADRETTRAIESLQTDIGPQQACGCRPLNGLLHLARARGLQVTTLETCNSGDTAGSRDRVVGYGAWALS